MRSSICGAAGLVAVGLLSLAPISASAQKAESALLGNKLWHSFEMVLRLQGQPTRIEVGAASGAGQAGGGAGGGGMMGGPSAAGGSSMGGGPYGGGGGQPSGGPYGSGLGSQMRSMYGGGGAGGGGKMSGMGGGGSLPGVGGMGVGQSGDLGLGGGMPGAMSGGGAGGGGGAVSAGEDGEITWVYEKPGGRTNIFLFNKDGRLIQVSSFGYSGNAVTSRGVRLGDPIGKIYATYKWTPNITKDTARNTMMLDYSKDHHVAFQLADRGRGYRVIGITVGITELTQLPGGGVGFSNARAAGGSMGGMGGGPMMGGAMGMGGGMPGSGGMRPGGMRGGQGSGGGSSKADN